jgi:hypothetical protein
MYSPVFIRTENQLNKILRNQRKTKQEMGVLFVSLWDDHSKELVEKVRGMKTDGPVNRKLKPLYVVNSFMMPHAFVIFKTSKVPHLVQFKRGSMESEDYLSMVYKQLGL